MPLEKTEISMVTLDDYKDECPEDVDVAVIFIDDFNSGRPVGVVPVSERARELFKDWGMDEGATGIVAPEEPMSLIAAMPRHWQFVCVLAIKGKMHKLQEVTLPTERVVVH